MFPVNGYMPCFPQFYPQNQSPQVMHQNYPCWGVIPPVINTDTVKAPSSFVPSSGNAHPNPSDSTPYNNHNCYPGYYTIFSPHPQSQPLPMHFCGPYPPHPNVLPSYYLPSTGYLPEQHGGSALGKIHCCGCPNHECPKQGDNHVSERKEQKFSGQKIDDCHSLPYNPYPMICIPGDNSNKVAGEIPKLNFMPPSSWKGWIPLDALPRKSLELAEEVGKKDKWQNEGTVERSFPMIWVPSNHRPEEAEKVVKELQPSSKIEEVPSCNVKIIPVKQSDCGNPNHNGSKIQQDLEAQGDLIHSKKVNKSKIIPVQDAPSPEENHVSATGEQVNEEVRLKNNARENGNEKSMSIPHSGRKSTPARSSKMPPVCLRVDPLPKNKKANGSSRLSSQPGQKEGGKDKTEKQGPGKDAIPGKIEKEIKIVGDEVKGNNQDLQSLVHGVDKSVSEVAEMSNMENNSELTDEPNPLLFSAESLDNMKQNDTSCNFGKLHQMEGKETESSLGAPSQENVKKHLHLSETDAAIIIQSAYRGFEIRKWQSLKKLKQIRAVNDKAADIKDKINNLETSSGDQLESKSKIFLSETVMNLLLELDTIQGLHPSVREIRKSVARELVLLQEKLDMLKKRPRGTDKILSDGGCEQAPDLQKTEANELAASAVENFPGTQLLEEDTVTCSDKGGSKQLEYDYSMGKEDGCISEKVVNSQSFSEDPGHLPGGCADASVEEQGCTDASVDEISGVLAMDEIIACPTEAAFLASSQTSSSQLECSTEVNEDASLLENGSMVSGTEQAFGASQEGEKEICAKDLDFSLEVEVHRDSSVVNDIPVDAMSDEVSSCLAVGLNTNKQSGGSENAGNNEEVNVSLEMFELQTTMQGEPNDISGECYSLEQQPLDLTLEQGKQVQAEEPKQSVDYLDMELGLAKEEENLQGKLDVNDALLARDDAGRTDTKELEEQLLPCGYIHEAMLDGETCILGSCVQSGMMHSDCLSDNDQTSPDKDNALAADNSTAAVISGTVSVPDAGEDIANPGVVVGPEAISPGIPSGSCLPSEEVQLENREFPDVGASLVLEEDGEQWKKWRQQDEGLRTMLNKLLEAGQKQMQVMSELSGRVNRLERRLSQKRRLRLKKRKGIGAAAAGGLSPLAAKSAA